MAFTTLPTSLRNEGTAMVALFRFIGTSVGISLLQMQMLRNAAAVQSRLVEGVRPGNPQVDWGMPGLDFDVIGPLASLYRQIARQAMMVAYIDTFWLMFALSMAMLPLAVLMKPPDEATPGDIHTIAGE